MSDIRKIIDSLNEMATVSGSVATVASPMGATQKRNKDSIFYEGDAVCHTCHQHECQCDANSRKAPEAPPVANFGLWKNSILAGKEQKAKKKSKVKESVTDYAPKSQGGTRKELLAKLRAAKSAEERSDLATRARKAGATQKELQDLSEDQYGGQYATKDEAIAYAKEKVKSFRDPDDGIEIWALPSGRFDVVHTMNSNGRNHVIKNGGKKLGTIGKRYKGVDESAGESWSIRFMDGGKEDKMTVKAATNREALKKWRAKRPDAEIIGISRAKQVDEAKESDELASDVTQRNLKKMAARHRDEEWSIEQLKKLGKKLRAPEKTRRVDELGNSLMPGGQRAVNLAEQDFILNPHDVRRVSKDVVPKIDPRQDHEVEMACSDLFQAAKNAREVLQLIKDIPESVGLEGWVQEKIIKAADYLNTVREYLEGQQVRSVMSGNFNMGNMLDESADNPLEAALVRRIMSQHTDALQHYGPRNVLAAIQDVAREFNPGDELGTSDVSAYVQQVLSYLRNNVGDVEQLDEVVPEILGLHGVIGGGLAASAAGIAGGATIAGVGLLISKIKDAATKLVKMAKGGDEDAQDAINLVVAKLDDSLEESVIAAGLAAGAAGILAKGLIGMINRVRERVEDDRYAKQIEAELNRVENYLSAASTQLAESRGSKE